MIFPRLESCRRTQQQSPVRRLNRCERRLIYASTAEEEVEVEVEVEVERDKGGGEEVIG